MAKLSYKVSYYVFYVCIALILVVLGMFYGVGYSETNAAGLVEPANTPALMYLMYGMFAVCVAVTVIAAVLQFGAALKDRKEMCRRLMQPLRPILPSCCLFSSLLQHQWILTVVWQDSCLLHRKIIRKRVILSLRKEMFSRFESTRMTS